MEGMFECWRHLGHIKTLSWRRRRYQTVWWLRDVNECISVQFLLFTRELIARNAWKLCLNHFPVVCGRGEYYSLVSPKTVSRDSRQAHRSHVGTWVSWCWQSPVASRWYPSSVRDSECLWKGVSSVRCTISYRVHFTFPARVAIIGMSWHWE